jgi:hypothetical protein
MNRSPAIDIVILEAFLHVQAPLPNGPVLQLCEASYPESDGQVLIECNLDQLDCNDSEHTLYYSTS